MIVCGWRIVTLFLLVLLDGSAMCTSEGARCSVPRVRVQVRHFAPAARQVGLSERECARGWSRIRERPENDSGILRKGCCWGDALALEHTGTLEFFDLSLQYLHCSQPFRPRLKLRGGNAEAVADNAVPMGGQEAAAVPASFVSEPLHHSRLGDATSDDGAADDGAEDGAAAAMDLTETVEPSVERDAAVLGTPQGAARLSGAGDASASVEDVNSKSPVGGAGSSYMGDMGMGDAGMGDVVSSVGGKGSGDGGSSGTGVMGSSSTVKMYRHPTSSTQRNLIREKFKGALEPFYRVREDKYTPLTAAVAIEHSMYRYFGKVSLSRSLCRAHTHTLSLSPPPPLPLHLPLPLPLFLPR